MDAHPTGSIAARRLVIGAALLLPLQSAGSAGGQTTAPRAGVSTTRPADLAGVKAQLAKLREKLNTAAPAGCTSDEKARSRGELSRLFDLTNSVSDWLEAGQFDDVNRALREALRQTETRTYRDDLVALSDAITAFQAADKAGFAARASGVMKTLGERLKTLKSADEVDALRAEFRDISQRFNRGNMPQDLRSQLEDVSRQIQQADQYLGRYSDMLGAEADGDFDGALQIGRGLTGESNSGGRRMPGLDVVRQRVEALDKRRELKVAAELQQAATAVQTAKTGDELAPVLRRLRTLAEKSQRSSFGDEAQRYFNDVQALQTWARVLDLQAAKRYQSALMALTEGRQRNNIDPRMQSGVVTEPLVAKKVAELQQQLLARGDEITDPTLKPLAESITKAASLDDLIKAAAAIDTIVGRQNGGQSDDHDARPIIQELVAASAQIKSLEEMRSALESREWGRFWQANAAATRGRANDFNAMPSPRVRWADALRGWRLELVREGLTNSAELDDLTLKLDGKTPPDRALLGAADAFVAKGDYRRAATALQAYLSFSYGLAGGFGEQQQMAPATLRADLRGLELFAQANNFETAGDFVPAVARYRAVLELNGPRVPVQQATERLAKIGKAKPELLADAPAPLEPLALPTTQPARRAR